MQYCLLLQDFLDGIIFAKPDSRNAYLRLHLHYKTEMYSGDLKLKEK